MLFPESDVHVAIGFPRVGLGDERLAGFFAAIDGCIVVCGNPVQEELMPFVEVNINIAEVFVATPVAFSLFGVV